MSQKRRSRVSLTVSSVVDTPEAMVISYCRDHVVLPTQQAMLRPVLSWYLAFACEDAGMPGDYTRGVALRCIHELELRITQLQEQFLPTLHQGSIHPVGNVAPLLTQSPVQPEEQIGSFLGSKASILKDFNLFGD